MKKITTTLAALSLLLLVSCQKTYYYECHCEYVGSGAGFDVEGWEQNVIIEQETEDEESAIYRCIEATGGRMFSDCSLVGKVSKEEAESR